MPHATVSLLMNPDNQVTRIMVAGDEDNFVLDELARLSETEFSSGRNPGEFIPDRKLIFRNILESYKFYQSGLEGVADISIETDKELVGFKWVVAALESYLAEAKSAKEKQDLSTLIDHICLEEWNGGCEGGCGQYISIIEVIKSCSILCDKCRAKEE